MVFAKMFLTKKLIPEDKINQKFSHKPFLSPSNCLN